MKESTRAKLMAEMESLKKAVLKLQKEEEKYMAKVRKDIFNPKLCFCKKPVASPKHKHYPQLCDNCRRSWINTKLDVSFEDWKALRLKALKLS